MDPTYTQSNCTPAYQLNWALTVFWRQRPRDDGWVGDLQAGTRPDGVRILNHRFREQNMSQFLLSTKPHISPQTFVRSVKGRLQYLVRDSIPKAFQKNYSFRSTGSARRSVVEDYVGKQVRHHRMADHRVQARLSEYQIADDAVDLSRPVRSAHAQYGYNLHLVLVNDGRWMEIRDDVLRKLRAALPRIAAKGGSRLSRGGVLPDHIHLTLGCSSGVSPEEIAMGFLNNCAYVYGMKPVFMFSYYVGTFGEYDLGAL